MRTSEIIMLKPSPRSASRARSPEETGTVAKPWLFKKESSKLRCHACLSRSDSTGHRLDFSPWRDGLHGVQQQVEQGLTQQLLVGFDGQLLIHHFEADALFLNIIVQRAHDLPQDNPKRQRRAAHF